jgi:import inner membrane translocase subunit TIM50
MPTLAVSGVAMYGAFTLLSSSKSDKSFVETALEDFEKFNDWSRDIFLSIGDRIVPLKPGPWLIDLETMKYPEYIPTLIMDLDKVLCHMEYDRKTGWQVVKRPGADQFLKEMQHYYELVVFSDDVVPVASEVMARWGVPCTGVLHRDFCRKTSKGYVKDISQLGRKSEKMIILDHESVAFSQQPKNGILIKPFTGDENDRELFDLIEFLKAAAVSQEDTREYIQKFGGGDEDIGKRFLIHKKEQDNKVASRRSFGRALAGNPSRLQSFNNKL